jgi:hypothetical protein
LIEGAEEEDSRRRLGRRLTGEVLDPSAAAVSEGSTETAVAGPRDLKRPARG